MTTMPRRQGFSRKVFKIYFGDCAIQGSQKHLINFFRWFQPDEVREALDRVAKNPRLRLKNDDPSAVFVPPRGAIANHLLKTWLKTYAKP
jgi:hypothetical protein